VPHNDKKIVLKTERLILREWREDDLLAFAELNADPAVMRHFPRTLTRADSDQLASRIRSQFDSHGYGLWAVEIPDVASFIGFVGLAIPTFDAHFTPCVEVGWRIARSHWRKGHATEAAERAVSFGFSELDLEEIVSLTVPANAASRRVMEKIGMHHNPDDDFDHPRLPKGHPLQRHVLYRLRTNKAIA